jgi:AcrR family transcriptional regulator
MDNKSASRSTKRQQRAPVKPVASRGQRTRQRLMAAAIKIIGAQGIAATSVSDIARRAGCGYGTFYKYFDSKTDLMRQALRDVYAEISEQVLSPVTAVVVDGSAARERIRLGVTKYTETLLRTWAVLKALDRAVGTDPELLILRDTLHHQGVERLARLVIQTEEAGHPRAADPYLEALALSSMVDEMARRWRVYGDQISKEDFIEVLVSILELVLLGQRSERVPSGHMTPLVMTPGG